jgi:hypothetical protein
MPHRYHQITTERVLSLRFSERLALEMITAVLSPLDTDERIGLLLTTLADHVADVPRPMRRSAPSSSGCACTSSWKWTATGAACQDVLHIPIRRDNAARTSAAARRRRATVWPVLAESRCGRGREPRPVRSTCMVPAPARSRLCGAQGRGGKSYPGALIFSLDTAFPGVQNSRRHGADTQSHKVPTVRFADASCVGSRRERAAFAAMRAVRPARSSQG